MPPCVTTGGVAACVAKPPANCKDYYYRIQVYDTCSLDPHGAGDPAPNAPNDPSTGQPTLGNIAETFEIRAIDRNLRTPYIQQWNLGRWKRINRPDSWSGPLMRKRREENWYMLVARVG